MDQSLNHAGGAAGSPLTPVPVTVRLFALARQLAGRSELTLELPAPPTVAALRHAIAQSCPELAPLVPNLLIAVDSEYSGDEQPIAPGAEVAVIPPVSGGSGRPRTAVSQTTRLLP